MKYQDIIKQPTLFLDQEHRQSYYGHPWFASNQQSEKIGDLH